MKFLQSLLVILIAATVLGSCSPEVRYEKGVDENDGGREWGALEVKLTVQKMVASLDDYLKSVGKENVYIQVKKFRNRTAEHIDSTLVTDEISTELIQRKIRFIDESLMDESIGEIDKANSEYFDQSTTAQKGKLKAPNLYLTGDIREAVTSKNGRELQFLVVTLKLYRIETGEIVWQDHARFLKSKKKGKNIGF